MQSEDSSGSLHWFGVRSIFKLGSEIYEERITLHRARDLDDALVRAEDAARGHVADIHTVDLPVEYLSQFGQAYALVDEPMSDGAEVFSLIRDSDLPSTAYIKRHFDTGTEHQEES